MEETTMACNEGGICPTWPFYHRIGHPKQAYSLENNDSGIDSSLSLKLDGKTVVIQSLFG